MSLWSKGVERSFTGKQRMENVRFDIEKLNMLESAFNRYFNDKHPFSPCGNLISSKRVYYKIHSDDVISWYIDGYQFKYVCSWNETRNMEHVLDLLNKEMDSYICSHPYSTEQKLDSFQNRLRMILNLSGDKFKHVLDMIWK